MSSVKKWPRNRGYERVAWMLRNYFAILCSLALELYPVKNGHVSMKSGNAEKQFENVIGGKN